MTSIVPRSWVFPAGEGSPHCTGEPISEDYLADESRSVSHLLEQARLERAKDEGVQRQARKLIEEIRRSRRSANGLDAFLGEYDLSSSEGIVLMCLAEALLRIPDTQTADKLIAEKLGDANWQSHVGVSDSLFVNASSWALMLTGRFVRPEEVRKQSLPTLLKRLMDRLGEPVVRAALRGAMKILGHQFVIGKTMDQALRRAHENPEYCYSFDMLGEAALTAKDAERYFNAYLSAIQRLGEAGQADNGITTAPSISVKLSALHPRFEPAQCGRAIPELAERLEQLAITSAQYDLALTVDAEEAGRLEPMLAVFERVFRNRSLSQYAGLGLAVQAYQKRAWRVLQWLEELASTHRRVIPVRLVKGAYWDTEIKRAQQQGLPGYPVFTRKSNTDVSYLACAKLLLLASPHLYPQFATHNAYTVAWILNVGQHNRFEFQRLHGMGEELYAELMRAPTFDQPVRVYAPVGAYEDLLPYLVRRLLENGANTSFVHRLTRPDASIEMLTANPVATARSRVDSLPNPAIALPADLFGVERRNSKGWNLSDTLELQRLAAALAQTRIGKWLAAPIIDGQKGTGAAVPQFDPADRRRRIGATIQATTADAQRALQTAYAFQSDWNATPARTRADILRRAAELFERDAPELMARCMAEAGKTLADSVNEIREAVDFLRYYANEAERLFAEPQTLPGPTGEHNELRLNGRGVFACISPWNFPLAIFTGQIAAALGAGNTVIAKPAEQSPLVAARAVELLNRAGLPWQALQFLPGDGPALGEILLSDARVAGCAFTGSGDTARAIQNVLAHREGPLATLIAETGGINAMIVDSSALPEQVVHDVVMSAFNSAGQRCSALRLLCLQHDTADRILDMLRGHMAELVIGDPALIKTDIGPVIDEDAQQRLSEYLGNTRHRILYQAPLDESHAHGLFVPPTLIELDSARDLDREIFGPVLHVVRYAEHRLDELIDDINSTGYGLTLGIHSRLGRVAKKIAARARVGNVYVNRNMIGAQVGVQPFGGTGLSGTGPKAGGPHYMPRFASEQTVSVNTMAIGGNASLLSLELGED